MDNKSAVGSAVLAGDELQSQLKNKKMIVRRRTDFSQSLYLLGRLMLCFLFSVGVYGALDYFELDNFFLYGEILSLSVTLSGVYRFMWRDGENDNTFVNFNNLKTGSFRGLRIGILASVPWILSTIYLWITFSANNQSTYAFYRLLSMPFHLLISIVNPSLYVADLSVLRMLILSVMPLLIVFASTFGYNLGFQGKKIHQFYSNLNC